MKKVIFVTKEKIKWTIGQFGSNKAAGPDGITPISLKKLLDEALERL